MAYDFLTAEEKVRELWDEKELGVLKDYGIDNFTVLIPPPNVTGSLHMGHALNCTIQDVYVRYMKLSGKNVCWIVGVDHGGIATQSVVEKNLLKEGISRHQITKEELYRRIEKFKEESGMVILDQLVKLGCMLDMTRFRYTMDEVSNYAVKYAFKKLYEDGLIYRGNRIVHYCPRCSTTLADIEVEYEEEITNLYYINYPLEDGFITIATVRPETMLADKAIAVNPNDDRYKNYIGKYATLPIIEEKIPVISDESVDPSFGTGAVKVTPAHDFADFEIAIKNNLEIKIIIDLNAKLINVPKEFEGLSVFEARKRVVEVLTSKGLIEKVEKYTHKVPRCYRCLNVVEAIVLKQWFLKTKPLTQRALDFNVEFYPSEWKYSYEKWMRDIKDWCLSRQIVWGHRIPVYYCDKGCINVELEEIKDCKCGSKNVTQDEDVLDTWFSSALWPLTTLGWPKKTQDLERL
ncbi:MAG: class I tRNA ligase family protein, partial [bacterium]|nr:class I tRNA ligase family protein [bacterium]